MIAPSAAGVAKESKRVARAACQQQAAAALASEIGFIDHCDFRQLRMSARAIEKRFADLLTDLVVMDDRQRDSHRVEHFVRMCSTPLLSAADERDLFRLMNFCKYRANAARSPLSAARPNRRKLAEFQQFSQLAARLRNHIVNANVRLVVSIVKKFSDRNNDFDELFSEGVHSLLRAAEKFDFDRGFRFSTYATCAIRRELANYVEKSARRRQRFGSGVGELLKTSLEPELPAGLAPRVHTKLYETLTGMMRRLDERERLIVQARYGFKSADGKRTFQSLGVELGVCKERVRQIEARALRKLRTIAKNSGLDLELALAADR